LCRDLSMDLVRRVYLRYAFSRDPKVVSREFEKLKGALKHLTTSKGDLTKGEDFQHYTQAIEAFRDIKYFVERAGVSVEAEALGHMNGNPFDPGQVVSDDAEVFKKGLAEVAKLEQAFEKAKPQAHP
jgi:hypothetical protein